MLAFLLVITMSGSDYIPQSWDHDGATECAVMAEALRLEAIDARCEVMRLDAESMP